MQAVNTVNRYTTYRPCITIHTTLIPEKCSYCWRAINVKSYQRKWGLPQTGKFDTYEARNPLEDMRKISRYTLPCINEGAIIEWCNTCNGEMKHVRECDVYEKCTRGYVSNLVRNCQSCAREPDSPYKNERQLKQEQEEKEKQVKEVTTVQPEIQPGRNMRNNRRLMLQQAAEQQKKVDEQRAPSLIAIRKTKDTLAVSKLKPNETKWAYGVTTVPNRLKNYLTRTMNSLCAAGFPNPHLFIDCQRDKKTGTYLYLPDLVKEYETEFPDCPITIHTTNIGTVGNWYTALIELFIRNPIADRFILFQDDIILCKDVREYLEHSEYPDKGYVNLMTFPENEQQKYNYLKHGGSGWYPSNQKGRSACALMFNRSALLDLIKSDFFHRKLQDTEKGHANLDGGISDAMKLAGYIEYVHTPSLTRHIGKDTSMPQPHPLEQPIDLSFQGENWSALELVKQEQ